MKRGDIILVPFPFTDLSSQKTRPALILSAGKTEGDLIALAMTSRLTNDALPIEERDLIEGHLPVRSFVRLDKIATLNISIVKKKVGCVKGDVMLDIVGKFKDQF